MKTIILESLINFKVGDSVVINPDYKRELLIDDYYKTKKGRVDFIDLNGNISVRYTTMDVKSKDSSYRTINYKYLKIIKCQQQKINERQIKK